MKYIKHQDLNYVNKNYLEGHFAEEEELQDQVPSDPIKPGSEEEYEVPRELIGLSREALEFNVTRLQKDMEGELETIRMRYSEKIEFYQKALTHLRKNKKSINK
mmetsp:Transcript_22481/g.21631  ORF Transcript_22481/g.21631 Transcript_22481/m.21631 type:complete len:104 (-) Transcript_22481:46-357(-)